MLCRMTAKPQLPMDYIPWMACSITLSEIPKVFVIKFPVCTSGCQIINRIAVFHKRGSFMRIPSRINSYKCPKSSRPSLNRLQDFWLHILLESKHRCPLCILQTCNTKLILCGVLHLGIKKNTKIDKFMRPDFFLPFV